jgi:phosphate transport system substrate-binding protein
MFTDYLSRVFPEWKDKVGTESPCSGPLAWAEKAIQGSFLRQANGSSIGYVEFAYALQNGLATTQMQKQKQ